VNDLVISLTGEITDSNFDEWKSDLLGQLKSVNTELKTDPQFAEASDNVKRFKAAEKALKKAKASAIKQAADINTLFEAIDEVAAETREVRLTLERQIRTRKQEIKEDAVRKGVAKVEALIDEQSDDFKLLDHSAFIDDDIFEEAAKGKSSSKGLHNAIDSAFAGLKEQIEGKAESVKVNASTIDSLASGFQVLFQDRANLLNMTKDELDATIDDRVNRFKEGQGADGHADDATSTDAVEASSDDTSETGSGGAMNADAETADFELSLSIHATEADATALYNKLKDAWLDTPEVTDIVLKAL